MAPPEEGTVVGPAEVALAAVVSATALAAVVADMGGVVREATVVG